MSNMNIDDLTALSLLTEKTENKCRELEDLQEKLSELKTRVNNSNLFTRLHPNVEWKILKMLKFKDYRNLAVTCRRWFHSASSAPDHVKPSLVIRIIYVKYPGMVIVSDDDYIEHHGFFICVPSLCLINKLTMRTLIIEAKGNMEFVRFIYEHRERLSFENLCIRPPVFCKERASMLYELAEKAERLIMDKEQVMEKTQDNAGTCVLDLNCLFGRPWLYLSVTSVRIQIDKNHINKILKRWANKENPNLEKISFSFPNQDFDLDDLFDSVTEGLEQFVFYKHRYVQRHLEAKFMVPQLKVLKIIVTGDEILIKIDGYI